MMLNSIINLILRRTDRLPADFHHSPLCPSLRATPFSSIYTWDVFFYLFCFRLRSLG